MNSVRHLSAASRTCIRQSSRLLHSTPTRHDITTLQMPAMSPTMTEGGIASWKKQPGEAFSAGDVLLEIETDKATIDVEAQDEGIMGKIIVPDGSKAIPVGQIIALLAQEGDDIANLEIPEASSSSMPPPPKTESAAPTPVSEPTSAPAKSHMSHPPSHSRPLFPSVHRLLMEYGIESTDQIKGTGVRGMLTKGDVLMFLGKVSGPMGTYKAPKPQPKPTAAGAKKDEPKILDGHALRQLIVSNMLKVSARPAVVLGPAPDFDSVLADYLPYAPKSLDIKPVPLPNAKAETASYFDGLI